MACRVGSILLYCQEAIHRDWVPLSVGGKGQTLLTLRQSGLSLGSRVGLKTSRTQDGQWVAWIEFDGEPLVAESGKPRLFEGPTRYQAQCRAFRWYSPEKTFSSLVPRVSVARASSPGTEFQ